MSKTILAQLDGFTPVIDRLAEQYGLFRAAVFGRMWRYCQMSDGVCRASLETIGQGLGVDRATIMRHAQALCDDGYLEDTTPSLRNRPHVYRDTGKIGLEVGIGAAERNSDVAERNVTVAQCNAGVAESQLKIVLKKESKKEERENIGAGAPASISTVESDDPWVDTPPLEVTVPSGGNKARRAEYTETCDKCQAKLTQTLDVCPDCGRPVKWIGSHDADKRAKSAASKLSDERAKNKREQAERHSTTTAFVLAIARATAPVAANCDYAAGEEDALYQYELSYGSELVRSKVNEFKAANEKGRGLILHLIRFLAQYNPQREKKDPNALMTPEELVADWAKAGFAPQDGDDE